MITCCFSSGNLYQDDIMLIKNRNAAPCTEKGCTWPKNGRFVIIPVQISSSYSKLLFDLQISQSLSNHNNDLLLGFYILDQSSKTTFKTRIMTGRDERFFIRNLLKEFVDRTCIRFVGKDNSHKNYLYIFPGSGCWSFVGMIKGRQPISLNKYGCLYTSVVQHEILHALGFHHEHSRSDRDQYILIKSENIRRGKERNFYKAKTINYNIPYDYNSVMQYRNKAFSKNGQPTIVAKDDPNRVLGSARSMTENEYKRVNIAYQCDLDKLQRKVLKGK
ncbi:low choriolytic enzyme-like [Cynoglossus semilaevis]|uniref:low choriolytic enzyme-like n=1 Tax=Cynoglossus semilaevis TaxID=244447 RepID=UPI000D630729|nr:low choriolytic enzyme-like [Cynoglossus semilaevis]